MRILVTGGAGFIGSALCREIIHETDHYVINVDKLGYSSSLQSLNMIAANQRYKLIQADITHLALITDIIRSTKPDAIIHLAAESHVDRSITNPAAFISSNILGTYYVLEAARNFWCTIDKKDEFRFLHVSTDEVYGALEHGGYFTESTPYQPNSPYAASKASSDHLVRAWHRTYGLPTLIANCSNNYGPFQFPEKFIPLVIISAMRNRELPVYGTGMNIRDWIYVEDHVRALLAILEKGTPGEKYNVGGKAERTNLSVVHAICDHLDTARPRSDNRRYRSFIKFVEDRPGHDFRYAVDTKKIERDLQWAALVNFEVGLEKTIAWYLENEDWWEPLLKTTYAGERLGLLPSNGKQVR